MGTKAGAQASGTTRFEGFPAEAFDFYEALADNNNRTWWNEHKEQYQRFVREPLVALLEELSAEFGTPHVFRPYRDARFSKDKSPVKDHQGGYTAVEDAIGYYVQVSGGGLMLGGGWYAPEGDQVMRYRTSVEGPAGSELERILKKLARTWQVDGNPVKTRPRGVDPDAPRLDLLRNRQLTVMRHYEPEEWVGTRAAFTRIRADWRAIRPLIEWLADYVGPARDPGRGD